MKSPRDILEKLRPRPSDVLGIDLSTSGTYVVHMRKTPPEHTLLSAVVLPPVPVPGENGQGEPAPAALDLPSGVHARYGCLTVPGDRAAVKLINLPGQLDPGDEDRIVSSLGIGNAADYRIAYKVVVRGHGKTESRTLAVALHEDAARMALDLLATGLPVPYSIEVAPVAALTAFLQSPGRDHEDDAVGLLMLGDDISHFSLFSSGVLVLIRRFGIGLNSFIAKVTQSLGVDTDTAAHILADGSFDISQAVEEVLSPLERQLILSRDFVERRDNCHVGQIYVCGSLARSPDVLHELSESIGMSLETWDPTTNLQVADDAFQDDDTVQRWNFGPAIGACLGVFDET